MASNGVGLVVLKRLKDALDDGDTIHAVIRGSAVTNDGALKVGYTAPSLEGQIETITRAHAAAGVSPESITYVEAHAAGTRHGDSDRGGRAVAGVPGRRPTRSASARSAR